MRCAADLADGPAATDGERGLLKLQPKRLGDLRVVAELLVRIQRQVVGREADVGVEQRAQALAHDPIDHAAVTVPEQPVVYDDQLCPGLRGLLKELEADAHGGEHSFDALAADHLQTHWAIVWKSGHVQRGIQKRDQIVAALGHPSAS